MSAIANDSLPAGGGDRPQTQVGHVQPYLSWHHALRVDSGQGYREFEHNAYKERLMAVQEPLPIFARFPVPGKVKTLLISALGAEC